MSKGVDTLVENHEEGESVNWPVAATGDGTATGATPGLTVPALVPARMINEFVYCPRLFYLEWVQDEFRHSSDTLEGRAIHRGVDHEGGTLPKPDEIDVDAHFLARGVLMSAPEAGLIARIDLIEGDNGTVCPVDYKKGSPGKLGPWDGDVAQLCAQAIILRENGYRCDEGVLYYAKTKQRITVPITDELVGTTLRCVERLRQAAAQPIPPPPLVDSPKCPRCSLVGICLPDEVNFFRGVRQEAVRRLVPARDDAGPLYVTSQGSTVGKTGERLSVRTVEGVKTEVRLIDIASLCVYGNVQVTSQALRALAERGVPILHLTYGGWLTAVTSGPAERNVLLRVAQYRVASDESASLALSKAFVSGKIRNLRTMLRRNHHEVPQTSLAELKRLAGAVRRVTTLEQLLGLEGMASRIYFSLFGGMLRAPSDFDFKQRARRPPSDPVNAILSFLYSLLTKDCTIACLSVGLDPYVGFYHQLHYGRPSLALDLAEEFRPIIADSVALTLLNNRMLGAGDFIRRGTACALTDRGRRAVIEAYEGRLQGLIRHPVFGYSISYRRVLEVQARLLSRVVMGELSEYRPFTTR